MTPQTKQQKIKEIEYQTRMLKNLKNWIRNLLIFSSIGVAVAYWALKIQEGPLFTAGGVVSVIFIVLSVVLSGVIGFAFKNGKSNVDKIIRQV